MFSMKTAFTPFTRAKTPERPINKASMQLFMEAYDRIAPKGLTGRTGFFTHENMTELGKLYLAAWGVLPIASRMKKGWYMPDYHTVLRVFGTVEQYHAAIVFTEEAA